MEEVEPSLNCLPHELTVIFTSNSIGFSRALNAILGPKPQVIRGKQPSEERTPHSNNTHPSFFNRNHNSTQWDLDWSRSIVAKSSILMEFWSKSSPERKKTTIPLPPLCGGVVSFFSSWKEKRFLFYSNPFLSIFAAEKKKGEVASGPAAFYLSLFLFSASLGGKKKEKMLRLFFFLFFFYSRFFAF